MRNFRKVPRQRVLHLRPVRQRPAASASTEAAADRSATPHQRAPGQAQGQRMAAAGQLAVGCSQAGVGFGRGWVSGGGDRAAGTGAALRAAAYSGEQLEAHHSLRRWRGEMRAVA